ncbi:molybdopterin-synthase adenylyltransferase MoeB [Caldichromatium japonicum]|uniref:Molybdopterin-synthase adenylyltransferase n=1 Tax=Caldichromatium japonicum TaxID=2699430 RepID=A0A6G7VEK5_9GAMM|nr:molybdopterin-synthase adenylyltransferase MoeB [Caldichromatium japonicum]QIK38404.1 molybdopterin-synthase adenylyltransferase MoeB [Caldichromatium japonicum]
MTDDELIRYSRQILLPQFGVEGQKRLRAARVLIVGLGGLGSAAACYLTAAGVGRLVLVDGDRVELSNLQRQILHTAERIGMPKTASARRSLAALNPTVELEVHEGRVGADSLPELVSGVDLVLDCSDNFPTRFALNAACYRATIPLISGAAIRFEGQLTAFSGRPGGPCYRCLYPEEGALDETCTANGVLGPLLGVIGSLQAIEAIKILTGIGEPLFGRLILFDALRLDWRQVRLPPDPACPICLGESA